MTEEVVELKQFWHMLLVLGLAMTPQLLTQRIMVVAVVAESGTTLNSVSSFSVLCAMILKVNLYGFWRERKREGGGERERGEGRLVLFLGGKIIEGWEGMGMEFYYVWERRERGKGSGGRSVKGDGIWTS